MGGAGTGAGGVGMGTGRIGLISYASSPGLAATYQSQEQQQRAARGFRWLLVQTVLATDMSVHFEWLKNFKEYAASGAGSGASAGFGGMSEDEERLMICQALIKCGDISNPVRFFPPVLLISFAHSLLLGLSDSATCRIRTLV